MRIAMDPVPLVLGIYAHVSKLLARTTERREGEDPADLVRRFGRQRGGSADREIKRVVRKLQSDVKTADKLLRKTSDVWKISQETDLVMLVVHARGDETAAPQAYVLLQPAEIRELLGSIRAAAKAAGEDEATVEQLERAADGLEARRDEYLAFGFDPWELD